MSSAKILCLHGFLQNAKTFSEKSSGLRKLLKKANIETVYIDGPTILQRSDLPFELDDEKWDAIVQADLNKSWFYHSEVSSELNLDTALAAVSQVLKEQGPFDGIIGFSQGAAVASIVTNKVKELAPEHPFFKFSVIFSGYSFTEPCPEKPDTLQITAKYAEAFEPSAPTQMVFVYGDNDAAVPAAKTKYLAALYKNSSQCKTMEVEFAGGHMVPNKKTVLQPIVDTILQTLKE